MSFSKAKALKLASKHVQQGKFQAAIEEYRRIVQADPGDITTLNILGDLYVKVGDTQEAIRAFVRIAEYYRRMENSELKAIATLKKASKLAPDNLEIAVKLAALYEGKNLMVDAQQQHLVIAEYYLREGRRDQAFNFFQKVIDSDPENIHLRIRIAESYLRELYLEPAYEAFVSAASELHRQGRPEEALKTYLKALKTKPDGRGALCAAVNLYLQRAETQPAESLIKHSLRTRPNDAELQNLLARVHQVSHDLRMAKQAISHAVELDPACFQYQVDLVSASDRAYATFFAAGSEWQRQGNQEEALQAYLKALKAKPESRAATLAAVELYLGRGETQAAVMLLRHLLRAQSEDAELLSLLGRVYCQANDFDAAEQTLGRAVNLDPACAQGVLGLASLLIQNGELDRALRQLDYITDILHEQHEDHRAVALLREVTARDANHLGALERLGAIYIRTGDTHLLAETLNALAQAAIYKGENGVAARALRQLIDLQPEDPWHRRLLRRVTGEDEATPPPAEMTVLAFAEDPFSPRSGQSTETSEAQVAYFPEMHLYSPLPEFEVIDTPAENEGVEYWKGIQALPTSPSEEASIKVVVEDGSESEMLRAEEADTAPLTPLPSSDEELTQPNDAPEPGTHNPTVNPIFMVRVEVQPETFSDTSWPRRTPAYPPKTAEAERTGAGWIRSRYRHRHRPK